MERHIQTLPMVHTSYTKIFILLIGITISSLANAKNVVAASNFFHKNILHLKTNTLAQLSSATMSPLKIDGMVDLSADFALNLPDEDAEEICDNGIDDDFDGMVDFDDDECEADCSFSITISGGCDRIDVDSPMSGWTYQWFKDGNLIAGATDEFYLPTAPEEGNYYVEIITPEGCFITSNTLIIANCCEPTELIILGVN